MNTRDAHADNRGSNTDNAVNVDSANNVLRSSRTQNPPIRFGQPYIY